MVRRPSTPRPRGRDINRALGGLRTAELTTAVSFMDWEPSIVIAAGKVDKLGMDIRSMKEPLTRAVRQVMTHSIAANFNAGGRPDAWEPWSDATISIREAFGWSGGDVLIRSGLLRQVASQMNIWTINDKSATIRDLPSKAWYGKVHQAGYEGNSMKARIKAHGGDRKKALESLLDQQYDILQGGVKVQGRRTRLERGTGTSKTSRYGGGGGTLGGGSPAIPARPFLLFQDEDEFKISDIFAEWLEERIDRTWGKL